jgi:hypothetical protein
MPSNELGKAKIYQNPEATCGYEMKQCGALAPFATVAAVVLI